MIVKFQYTTASNQMLMTRVEELSRSSEVSIKVSEELKLRFEDFGSPIYAETLRLKYHLSAHFDDYRKNGPHRFPTVRNVMKKLFV